MKLDGRFAGTPLKEFHTTISWRATTNFAAAVADGNPLYFDDRKGKNLIAPPTFPVAVTWPIISRLRDFIAVDHFPNNVLWTQVHYTEHLILHRMIRPGDDLTVSGAVAAILPHRAGTHAIIRLFAEDKENQPVFTEYVGAMLRGIECDHGREAEELPRWPKLEPESDHVTDPYWNVRVSIDPLLPHVYDGCTDIEFPIHTSPRFAENVGLPGNILQGTATLALAVKEIVNREAAGNPVCIKEVACKFTGMVMPGTEISIRCLKSRKGAGHRDIFFEVKNSDNQRAIRSGYVKLGGERYKQASNKSPF